jgi:hypothetical protein
VDFQNQPFPKKMRTHFHNIHPVSSHLITRSSAGVAALLLLGSMPAATAAGTADLPPAPERGITGDWLLDDKNLKAGVFRTGHPNELVLENGLVRRTFRIAPNAATVGLDHQITGHAALRAVRPEAEVTINGVTYPVGGLTGQENHAFLLPEWLDGLEADPAAFVFTGFEIGVPEERFGWKQVRHHAPDMAWPPRGVSLRLDFTAPQATLAASAQDSATGRETLWKDDFMRPEAAWKISASAIDGRVSFHNEGKPGEIYAPAKVHCYAERELPEGAGLVEAVISAGTDVAVSHGPGMGIVFANGHVVKVNLRPGDRGAHGHFELRNGGQESLATLPEFATSDGGLETGRDYRIRTRLEAARMHFEVTDANTPTGMWHPLFTTSRDAAWGAPTALRLGKTDRQGAASDDLDGAGEWGRCRIIAAAAYGPFHAESLPDTARGAPVRISVHYELYDGVPVFCKWITVHNGGTTRLTVDRFSSEILAVAEEHNPVESRAGVPHPIPQVIHAETDFSFGGFTHADGNRHVVHWRPDPQYSSIVNYPREQPTLLVVSPSEGPAQDVEPGKTFESYRTFELIHDSTCRIRRGLALKRMYRTIAPWTTENPLMHHVLDAQPEVVRQAIDNAAEIGFEMIILSFGSGFDIENEDPAFLGTWKEVADYARSKGIDIGTYSLLSSRRIGGGNDIVSPPGEVPSHLSCPALTSEWGLDHFRRLYAFFRHTGFSVLEHDGSYPGDVDVTPRPPLQKGAEDSRWAQWQIIRDYYRWCRSEGIYLNVPDFYFLNGANKTAMGYREVNWSLPRAQQVIHTRQNIYDGTWEKSPSMGWMFVPLAQYHGGGAAATIEPLDQHRDHYGLMLASNLAMGVQACYRGPRLFDTAATRDLVKHWVDWFKEHRDILESDMVPGRRADGRDLDWMLHVNPKLDTKGMLVVFNPLNHEITRTLDIDLHYTGLKGRARVSAMGGAETEHPLDDRTRLRFPISVPAGGMFWATLR